MPSQAQTLVRIHDTAQRVVAMTEKNEKLGLVTGCFPATLRVDPIDGWTLLEVQLGTVEPGPPFHHQPGIEELISLRLDALNDSIAANKGITIGTTSGDYINGHGGAVWLQDFQMVYASLNENAMADEAIALTIAVQAGLLTKKALVQRGRLNPRSDYFNPFLRRLLTHCTWTN